MDDSRKPRKDIPPAVFSDDPQAELEEKLRKHPGNEDIEVDVGSDESMDASDPISAVRPEAEGPVPSSRSGEDEEEEDPDKQA